LNGCKFGKNRLCNSMGMPESYIFQKEKEKKYIYITTVKSSFVSKILMRLVIESN
jgi:hypothetical protein